MFFASISKLDCIVIIEQSVRCYSIYSQQLNLASTDAVIAEDGIKKYVMFIASTLWQWYDLYLGRCCYLCHTLHKFACTRSDCLVVAIARWAG